jgi:cytochrome P450
MIMEQWRWLNSHLSATLQARLSSGIRADPPSIFDHIVDLKPDITTEELIHVQTSLVVAGMHITAAGLTQGVYDMTAHPEKARELRGEVLGAFDNQWTKSSLGELKKLDSWMKESQRMASADLSILSCCLWT